MQVMLHDRDNQMLMLNKDDPEMVYVMDMHRGEIIEEWQVRK
jgi:hypothetical protein